MPSPHQLADADADPDSLPDRIGNPERICVLAPGEPFVLAPGEPLGCNG